MPDLPAALRLLYDDERPAPADVPLAEVYLDPRFPPARADRPFVYANMVQTLDGQAVLGGTAYRIGTDVDHFLLRQLRVHADAVLYGAGTLRTDDIVVATHPELQERRRREGRPPNPTAIVITGDAAFSDEVLARRKFFTRADLDRLLVTTPRAAPEAIARVRARGVPVEIGEADAQGGVDLAALLRRLRERRIRCLLCEGGPTLLTALIRADAVDELFVTVAFRLGGAPDEPRIVAGPVPVDRLLLRSALLYAGPEGGRELYLRFRLPRP